MLPLLAECVSVMNLSIIELRPHRCQPQSRCAIGATGLAGDQAPPPEPLEQRQRAIGKHIAFTRKAIDLRNPAAIIAAVDNATTLRQRVKHALFVF